MHKVDKYKVKGTSTLLEVLTIFEEASHKSMPTGIAVITDDSEKVIGTITEGDIRRAIIRGEKLDSQVTEAANYNPICFSHELSYRQILDSIPVELEKKGRKSKKFLNKILIVNGDQELVRILDYHQLWEQRVATHRHIVVMGLGYVGLTLAAVLADEGFLVTGFDPDKSKISNLLNRVSYVHENGLNEILAEEVGKNFLPTSTMPENGDVYIISVGTPVEKKGTDVHPTPNLRYIQEVSKQVGSKLKPGNLVILRSTVPIGTSRNVVIKELEASSGLRCGDDFHLAFAPERTAEGKALKELRELPQIIGGFNEDSTEATAALFREITSNIIRVSSLEAAETVKLVNNSFRDLIFAFSNHVSQLVSNFNIDIHEVIKAANQGYARDPVPLPSPGVGGPCLTKDPYIFAQVAKEQNILHSLFHAGRVVNESMHGYMVERLRNCLKNIGKDIASAKILVCGLAFKGHPETADIRESSALVIHNMIKLECNHVFGHDPVTSTEELQGAGISPVTLMNGFQDMDVVLFLNNHHSYSKIDVFKMVRLLADQPIIVDGWKLFHSEDILKVKPCIYMGLSVTHSSIVTG